MPPKKLSKSPAKGTAKAPAGSGAVAKSAAKGGTSPTKAAGKKSGGTDGTKTAPAPAKKTTATKTLVKTAGGGNAGPKDEPPVVVIKFTEAEATMVLQATGRAFADRQFQGSKYYRRLRKVIANETEAANTKRMVLERQRMQKEKAITRTVEDKKEIKRKLQESLCIAAFEGENAELAVLIDSKGANPLKADGQGNYAVGEAAVNGQAATVKLLVEKYSADPNCRGAFERTPLWRAAFNSHADTMKQLLELGADPRLKAQAQLPSDMASGDAAKVLSSWDTSKTDHIVSTQLAVREAKEAKLKAEAAKELDELGDKTEKARVLYQAATKRLSHAKQSYERKIYEYDMTKNDIALNIVKDAEKDVDAAEKERDETMNAYLDAKALEGEHRQQLGDLPGEEVNLKKFAEVVMNDGQEKWRNKYNHEDPTPTTDKKWPLVIDCTDKIGMFLRYRNTNYVDAINPVQMGPEKLRVALIGSIRHGKPLVLDLKDVPLVEFMQEKFDAILGPEGGANGKGGAAPFSVWDAILSREIIKPEKYLKLVKDEVDGDRYAANRFQRSVVAEFALIVLTTAFVVEDDLVKLFTPYRILDEL